METELYHHGVKGMKWGVRRVKKRTATERGAKQQAKKVAKRISESIARGRAYCQSLRDAFMQGVNEQTALLQQQNIQQGQQFVIQQEQNRIFNENAIRAANRTASLSLSNGMNPFMFG